MMRIVAFALIVTATILLLGCSGGNAVPVTPDNEMIAEAEWNGQGDNHILWGLWQFKADPEKQTLEAAQLRAPDMHLNALHFLEPPLLAYLTIENLQFNGNIIDVDIGLRHPFLGLDQFTGFDVCGVLISNGSVSGFNDPGLVMTGMGDTRLLNPDGYTRWWNPAEFPHGGTMFNYIDGLLGSPDEYADYNSTINAYKYFSDELGPEDDVVSQDQSKRGLFSAGQKNIRHYTIEIGGAGLLFNYAVDAAWKMPVGSPPWVVPDDFGPAANRQEAWFADVSETSNTLWNDGVSSGGGLALSINIYDWFNAGMNNVRVESPGNFILVENSTPDPGGIEYSTYNIEILNATPAEDSIDILVSVESETVGYGGLLPGEPVTAYFAHTAEVADSPGEEYVLVLEDPVQIIDPIHGDWPQLDDFSPTISESADGSMLVIWYAVNDTNDIVGYYEGGSNWGSKIYAFKSFDSGAMWSEGQGEHYGVGAELIVRNAIKSLPYSTGTRMHCVWPGYPSSTSSTNYVTQLENTDQHSVYWKIKADRQVDAVIRDDLKLVVFSDNGHEINAQVSTGSDWDDPSPFWYPPGETHPDHLVADPGYLSSVRSVARDDEGTLWLVYYTGDGGDENSVVVVSSPDGMIWTTEATFDLDPSLYTEVRNPSICINGDKKIVTYSCKNVPGPGFDSFRHDDDGTGFNSGVQLISYPGEINDIQSILGITSGQELTAFAMKSNHYISCSYNIAGQFNSVTISDFAREASMPDFIFDEVPGTPDAYMHFVWCERDDADDNWEVFYRRGYIEMQ